jgi:hypothetical protein
MLSQLETVIYRGALQCGYTWCVGKSKRRPRLIEYLQLRRDSLAYLGFNFEGRCF